MLKLFKSLFRKDYEDLSGAAFRDRYGATKSAVLIDVRTPEEFRAGSIKGAINLNALSTGFSDRILTMDKDKTYFLFCRSGMRSAKACSIMAKAGFRVVNLKGGMSAWPAKK